MKIPDLRPSRWNSDIVISVGVGIMGLFIMFEMDDVPFPEAWRIPISIAFGVGTGWLGYLANRDPKR